MFEKKNPLPGAERHPSLGDWYAFAGASEDHPQMRGGIIRPFGGVNVIVFVFRHEPFEELMKIRSRRWIGIFIDD